MTFSDKSNYQEACLRALNSEDSGLAADILIQLSYEWSKEGDVLAQEFKDRFSNRRGAVIDYVNQMKLAKYDVR